MAVRADATTTTQSAVPDLPELDLAARPASRSASRSQPVTESDDPLELAVDPLALVRERQTNDAAEQAIVQAPSAPESTDLSFDVRLLGDYGDPPRHWIATPLYAWRVFRRRRELGAALARRREEADRTAGELEEALVDFARRIRPTAEAAQTYRAAIDELQQAEGLLRSRDQVLATDQDALRERLAQADARLLRLEADLGRLRAEESAASADLAAAEEALDREEGRLRRAEIELRAAQQVGGGRETGP